MRSPEILARRLPGVLPLAVIVALGCGGAAAQEPERGPLAEALRALDAQQRRVAELERANAALESERAALADRLRTAEQRLGLRDFEPTMLKPVRGALTFRPDHAQRVGEAGARARKVDLRRKESDRPFVVAYWATWCVPCVAPDEIAALRDLRVQVDRAGGSLWSVAVDDLAAVQGDARASGWFYPLLQRKDAHLEWLPKAFIDQAGLGLPLFLVMRPDGELLWWRHGTLEPPAVDELVTAVIRAQR